MKMPTSSARLEVVKKTTVCNEVREWRDEFEKYELSIIFSHGSSMDRTNVTSTHILQRHNNLRHLELGGRVQFRSGFGEIRQWLDASLSTEGCIPAS